MIATEQISELIKEPKLVSSDLVPDLKEISSKYPYCSSLYILHLKGMAQNGNVHFEEELKKSAINVMDREKLYSLIKGPQQESEPIIEIAKEEDLIVEEESPIEEISDEKTTEEQEEITEEVETDSELEKEIISTAVSAAYEISSEEIVEPEEESAISEAFEEENEFTEVSEDLEPEIEPQFEIDTSQMSFIEWLNFKKTGKVSIEEKTSEPKKKIEIEFDLPDKKVKKKETKKEIDELLDKFIKEEPTISKPTKEFYNPTKSAKQSLEESPDLVSETLAKIHELQKNYGKAISAYEQLSLLYPEKKAFFASRIKEIKEKQAQE